MRGLPRGKRGSMTAKQLSPGLWRISAAEEKLRVFGQSSLTEFGQTYCTYLIDADDGMILIGTPPERHVEHWMNELTKLCGSKAVKWLILQGGDNDRSAALAIIEQWPGVALVATMNELFDIKGQLPRHSGDIELRTHRKLKLGDKELICKVLSDRFAGPQLYVIDAEDSILFTADAFGSNCAPGGELVTELTDTSVWLHGAELFAEDIAARKRGGTMAQAAELIREHDIKHICHARGPIADDQLDKLTEIFTRGMPAPNEVPTVAVLYTRDGYLQQLAEGISFGAAQTGPRVRPIDLGAVSRTAAMRIAREADALLLGVAEKDGDAVKAMWDLCTSLKAEDMRGKPAALFVSTMSKAAAAENIRARLSALGCDLGNGDYTIQGKPEMPDLKNAIEFAFGFGCYMQRIPNPRKPKLVKCLVCGEIFDASMGICPVCGVGLDQCVPADEDEVLFHNDTNNRYVILGGGVAAVSAAQAIRSRDDTGSITILSAEDYLPINRPMLSKDIKAVSADPGSIAMHDEAWYEQQGIDLHLGQEAIRVDPELKTVKTCHGELVEYDKLIFATGAECFVPPIKGSDLGGVLTLRHLGDTLELADLMEESKTAVVIGGGAIGLEAASELMRAGLKVTVLEAAPQIVGRQIDADTAALLKEKMAGLGVQCLEGVNISAIEGESRVTGVRLDDDRLFPADLVVMSCGNRANTQAAMTAGVKIDRAIVVDQFMRTNVADIYACGDCAQLDGVNFQLWQEATDQGRTAGANAAGDKVAYANRPMGLSLEGFGTTLFAMGDAGKREGVPYKTVTLQDGVKGSNEKYWFYGGSLEGAVLLGAGDKTVSVTQAVTNHARYTELF